MKKMYLALILLVAAGIWMADQSVSAADVGYPGYQKVTIIFRPVVGENDYSAQMNRVWLYQVNADGSLKLIEYKDYD